MPTSFLTADTGASIGQPDSKYPLQSTLYLATPMPAAISASGGDELPSEVVWLKERLASLVDHHAENHPDLTHLTWPVSSFDGEEGAKFDGIDVLALHGMLNLADQWHDLKVGEEQEAGLSSVQSLMVDHIQRIQAEIHWLSDIPEEDELPSQLGIYSDVERDAIEDVLLYGMADSKGVAGNGLREPFRLLGIALYSKQDGPDAPGLIPLCINEHQSSGIGRSLPCPVQGDPADADLEDPAYRHHLEGMRRLSQQDAPTPEYGATVSSDSPAL